MRLLTILVLLTTIACTCGSGSKETYCDYSWDECEEVDQVQCIQIHRSSSALACDGTNHNHDKCPCACYKVDNCKDHEKKSKSKSNSKESKEKEEKTEEELSPEVSEPEIEEEVDSVEPPSDETCLHGDDQVLTSSGLMTIRDLVNAGEVKVQGMHSNGHLVMTDVQFWIHKEPNKVTLFHEFHTESNHTISMTPDHLANTVPCKGGPIIAKYTHRVTIGECFLVESQTGLTPSKVTHMKTTHKTGYYTFIAGTDSIIVNGIATSTFSSMENVKMYRMWFNALNAVVGYMPRAVRGMFYSALSEPMLTIGLYSAV